MGGWRVTEQEWILKAVRIDKHGSVNHLGHWQILGQRRDAGLWKWHRKNKIPVLHYVLVRKMRKVLWLSSVLLVSRSIFYTGEVWGGACGRNHLSACKESRLLGLSRLGKAISSLLWLDVSEWWGGAAVLLCHCYSPLSLLRLSTKHRQTPEGWIQENSLTLMFLWVI